MTIEFPKQSCDQLQILLDVVIVGYVTALSKPLCHPFFSFPNVQCCKQKMLPPYFFLIFLSFVFLGDGWDSGRDNKSLLIT